MTNVFIFLKLQEIDLSRRSNSAMTIATLLQEETKTCNVGVYSSVYLLNGLFGHCAFPTYPKDVYRNG